METPNISRYRLSPDRLRTPCTPANFAFSTTDDIPPIREFIGQQRAIRAVEFGLGIQRPGFNIYVMGPEGSGKESLVRQFLAQCAQNAPTPDDWAYVHNFHAPDHPRALRFPAGSATRFANDMRRLLDEALPALVAAFESPEYRQLRKRLEREVDAPRRRAFQDLQQAANAQGLAIVEGDETLEIVPIHEGDVMSPEQYHQLPPQEQERLRQAQADIEAQLEELLVQIPAWQRAFRQQERALMRQVAEVTLTPLFDDLREAYANLPDVLDYLDAVKRDMLEHIPILLNIGARDPFTTEGAEALQTQLFLRRYAVNVLVDNSQQQGAPIVTLMFPSYFQLVGRIDQIMQNGSIISDFTMIHAGALHKANGGYLLIEADDLFHEPYAWDALKRALRHGHIHIETPDAMLDRNAAKTLEPDPIPLNTKVILLGERGLYYFLRDIDDDFGELFKVVADFENDMPRTPEMEQQYAKLIATLVQKNGLRPATRAAVLRLIETSARWAGDAQRLSAQLRDVEDVLQEADYHAAQENARHIDTRHIQRALAAREERLARYRDAVWRDILDGLTRVQVQGKVVGQLNGLAVREVGGYAFGHPSRITARVWIGHGNVVDIDRETNMAGPIHNKGLLTILGLLNGRYANEIPLAFSASLTFEQSYDGIEGDSASVAELCTLLSAITNVPAKQSLAVTGSIDQFGVIQPIGAVNEKIEGFFAICNALGLTGDQGVIIPSANVRHLMLSDEVVQAVEAGRFHIYAVETLEDVIELLFDMPAGTPDEHGAYPEGTFNALLVEKLTEFARKRATYDKRFHRDDEEEEEKKEEWGAHPAEEDDEQSDTPKGAPESDKDENDPQEEATA